MKKTDITFKYEFVFKHLEKRFFDVCLDANTLSLKGKPPETIPFWALLSYKQCACCPLISKNVFYCPIALNLAELVSVFQDIVSYDSCTVRCIGNERTYLKQTSVSDGLSSIFGVVMATSNCPKMDFLKPMARFHLPFASLEETTFRVTSMYLLQQYFESKHQPARLFSFESLERHYVNVRMVNEGLLNRIQSLGEQDADKNAIVTLHALSHFLSQEFQFSLESLDYLFNRETRTHPKGKKTVG